MIRPGPVKNMDCWTRNERLYRHLLSLGLVVHPVFVDEAQTRIDHLRVSAGALLSDFVEVEVEGVVEGDGAIVAFLSRD